MSERTLRAPKPNWLRALPSAEAKALRAAPRVRSYQAGESVFGPSRDPNEIYVLEASRAASPAPRQGARHRNAQGLTIGLPLTHPGAWRRSPGRQRTAVIDPRRDRLRSP